MALKDAIVVVHQVQFAGINAGPPATAVLTFAVALAPVDGSTGINENVDVTRVITSTAAQWKTDAVAAIKAWAQAPPGSSDTYTIVRLIGLVDIATVVP